MTDIMMVITMMQYIPRQMELVPAKKLSIFDHWRETEEVLKKMHKYIHQIIQLKSKQLILKYI